MCFQAVPPPPHILQKEGGAVNKTTLRGASANDEKRKDAKEAQRRLFNASTNNNTKESASPDSNETKGSVALLDNNNARASVVLADDDNSVFNSGSMATVSQMDNIEVNSLLNPISAGAMSQVSGEVLGGYELQPINPSDPLDDSTGDWVAWCDKDQVALQSVPEENEGDEETPVKVTSLVRLIVDLSLGLKLFFPFPTLEATFLSLTLHSETASSSLTFTFRNNFFELNFYIQKQLFRA